MQDLGFQIIHRTEDEFSEAFREDLIGAEGSVTVLSPFVARKRAIYYYPIFLVLTMRQVSVDVYTRPRSEQPEGLLQQYDDVQRGLKRSGVRIQARPGMHEKVGVVDGRILWHGSLNILSHNDSRESMLRFESAELVKEIMEGLGLAYSQQEERKEDDRKIAETGDSSVDWGAGVRSCPKCQGAMHYFKEVGLWICDQSPRCPETLTSVISQSEVSETEETREVMKRISLSCPLVSETEETREVMKRISLSCPLCKRPMEIKHGVILRVTCHSEVCGFSLDPRLSAGLVRILRRRGEV